MTMASSISWGSDSNQQVTCIACGEILSRDDAREYDKDGDRWSREGKVFEYLCKPCHQDYCHQNRDGLEEMLIAADAGEIDRSTFLRRFCELAVGNPELDGKES